VRDAWDVSPETAIKIQEQLRREVEVKDAFHRVCLIGGADVAYGDGIAMAVAAVVSFPELELCEYATARVPVQFGYLPGLLSFRETPPILEALARLRRLPDLLLCDGQGYAHPRRFGLACHIGVLTQFPAIGVAKTLLAGRHGELRPERGSWAPLIEGTEVIGGAIRTRTGVKPVYVSIGNKICLESAIRYVLACCRYRIPEPLRWADHLARKCQRHGIGGPAF
jgi:deoxyribonuclease V